MRGNQNSSRQGAKTQRDARWEFLLIFANFAYFAALRETAWSAYGLIRAFSWHWKASAPRREGVLTTNYACRLFQEIAGREARH